MTKTLHKTQSGSLAISPPGGVAILLVALLWVAGTSVASAQDGGGYSYFRVVEGTSTLFQAGSGDRSQAQLNQPVLAGDRVWVPSGSRVEVELADHNLVRLGGDSELVFDRLANSADTQDTGSVLRLLRGDLQLEVVDYAAGQELPRVDTPNATVYVQSTGLYRVSSDAATWSQVTVRSGSVEVLTLRGSMIVRPGEQAAVEGDRWPQVVLSAAPGEDALERWGEDLRQRAQQASTDYVDPSLSYAAAPLEQNGNWVDVGGEVAWRPYAAADWRPYTVGTWVYSPAGLTFVSGEPWGWVTYHYGTWDYYPTWGWLWHPGRVWAPAWVYWYWGPTYVGWCPIGYYRSYYRPYYGGFGGGLHAGIYGWAGGSFGFFYDWSFVHHDRFGDRHQRGWVHSGRDLGHSGRYGELERGIVTSDTRGITPERWRRPGDVLRVLQEEGVHTDRGGRQLRDLPDVTPFVARQRDLPREVRDRVLAPTASGNPSGRVGSGRRVIDWSDAPRPAVDRRTAGGPAPQASPLSALPPGRLDPGRNDGTSGRDRPDVTAGGSVRPAPLGRPAGVDKAPPARPAAGDESGRPGVRISPRPPATVTAPAPATVREPRPGVQRPPTPPGDQRGRQGAPPPVADESWRTRGQAAASTGAGTASSEPVRRVVDGIRSFRGPSGALPGAATATPRPPAGLPVTPQPGVVRRPQIPVPVTPQPGGVRPQIPVPVTPQPGIVRPPTPAPAPGTPGTARPPNAPPARPEAAPQRPAPSDPPPAARTPAKSARPTPARPSSARAPSRPQSGASGRTTGGRGSSRPSGGSGSKPRGSGDGGGRG